MNSKKFQNHDAAADIPLVALPRESLAPRAEPAADGDIPLIPWESLDQGKGQLHIAFQGKIYLLRVTRNGKLILTK